MRGATTAMRRGQLPEPAYRTQIDVFWRSMGVTLSGGTLPATDAAMGGRPGAGAISRTSPPVPASSVEAPLADRLAAIARLHADGILTDDEFVAAKRHLLER